MTTVTIEEAQAKLPELIGQLAANEELVITKNEKPIARLLAEVKPKRQPRKARSAKGIVTFVFDDDEPPMTERRIDPRTRDDVRWLIENPDMTKGSSYHDSGSCWTLIEGFREEIRSLTGRVKPKRCVCCGEVRESTELLCGQCGCCLDGPCD